jgi:hypothetical protein
LVPVTKPVELLYGKVSIVPTRDPTRNGFGKMLPEKGSFLLSGGDFL